MTDPIEEDIKRSRTKKRMQQYQDYFESVSKSKEKPTGQIKGKKVSQIPSEDSPIKNPFRK